MTDHEKKNFCKRLTAAGADKATVKQWFKTLERMEKTAPAALAEYRRAYAALQKLARLIGQMEQSLIAGTQARQGSAGQDDRNAAPSPVVGTAEWTAYAQDFGLLQGTYDHPFVIAQEDTEFRLTYEAVLSMLTSGDTDELFLQNELENLLDLTRERLQADRPQEDALCYYYAQDLGGRLTGLSREERVAKLQRIYRREFTDGMEEMCRTALHMDAAQAAEQVREICRGIRS